MAHCLRGMSPWLAVWLMMASPGLAAARETAVFGGGCFWAFQTEFEMLKGVDKVVVGYAGGHMPNPSYEDVSGGSTGHAEVIQVTFDPRQISYQNLLRIFMGAHDPTTPNRQGADVGEQYRSIILTQGGRQGETARRLLAELQRTRAYSKPIVTQIQPLDCFYPAESYHQQYFAKNPNQPYCSLVVAGKVGEFKKKFAQWLKPAS